MCSVHLRVGRISCRSRKSKIAQKQDTRRIDFHVVDFCESSLVFVSWRHVYAVDVRSEPSAALLYPRSNLIRIGVSHYIYWGIWYITNFWGCSILVPTLSEKWKVSDKAKHSIVVCRVTPYTCWAILVSFQTRSVECMLIVNMLTTLGAAQMRY